EKGLPSQGELGARYRAGVPQQQNNGNLGEVTANPPQDEVHTNVLDEPPPDHMRLIELIDPDIPDLAGQNAGRRRQKLRGPLTRAQILATAPLREQRDFARIERLEHYPAGDPAGDGVVEPRGSGASGGGRPDPCGGNAWRGV